MKAQAHASDERFRLALEAAGALVYEVAPTGSIVAHGLGRVTGYSPDEVDLTLDWWLSLIHPDDLPEQRERIARAMTTAGPYRAVYRIRRKDGEWIWVESIGQVIIDESGAAAKVVGALVDITDRKQAVDALRESEQRFRMLHALSGRLLAARVLNTALEELLDCAIECCKADFGNVQLFNPQIQALEIVAQRGFRQPFLDYFRAVRVDEGSACAQVLQSGQQLMIEDVELNAEFAPHRAVAAEAGYRAVISTPLKACDGNVVGMLSTHFRGPCSVPQQDRQLLEILACQAADLVSRLRFEQALREAERCKDEFLAMLAHELRNPLAPLRNALDLLKLAPGDLGLIERAFKTMDRQIVQLTRLVDDLLDMSRIVNRKLELRLQSVDLATTLYESAEACQPLIERRSQSLGIELPMEPIHLHADPARLAQVFSNLIMNASKYSGTGSQIRVVAVHDDAHITVSVCDSGSGIPPELLHRIFDLFMQVDARPERSGGGLGIGLQLVKRLVEMHGGTVAAQSEGIGRGSRFVVRLPTVPSGASEQARQFAGTAL